MPQPLELIVVADGDTDSSWQVAKHRGAPVIRLASSHGPAYARSLGAKETREDILLFVDADVTVPLIAMGIEECSRLGLLTPADVEGGTVVRMLKAYPVYDHGYQEGLATIRHYLSTFSNLQTIGRTGPHQYNNQDHSLLTGIYAARNTCGESHDVWSVNTEQAYHEEEPTQQQFTERVVPFRIRGGVTSAALAMVFVPEES
jgi:glycosyltransferase involved in cell wall biosynthesis